VVDRDRPRRKLISAIRLLRHPGGRRSTASPGDDPVRRPAGMVRSCTWGARGCLLALPYPTRWRRRSSEPARLGRPPFNHATVSPSSGTSA
jgi:hypothetical protein